jgi:Domain of unknown function (DUF4276)
MSGVAIYMEGGGDSRDSKAALRQGMDVFLDPLKAAARARSWRWKLVCCGPRQDTFGAFVHALRSGESAVVVLLVDAEGPVIAPPSAYLQAREGWDLRDVPDGVVHLMIQTMEAWIVADALALATYYGQRFNANSLPKALNLETVPRTRLASALERATRSTQKGAYHKIRHASDLLQRIDRQKVQRRCPSCARLFDTLGGVIAAA